MAAPVLRTALAIACWLATGPAVAELPTSVSQGGSSPDYGAYEPQQAKSLGELSPQIRQRLERHLRARLGEAFFAQLQFEGGDIVDRAKWLEAEPEARNDRREMPAYRLNYGFRMPEAGIGHYVATIELRTDGSILREITLPCFRCHPEKLKFVPLPDGSDAAASYGMSRSTASVELAYSADVDSLVWVYTQKVSDDGQANYDRLVLDAHSGEIVARSVSEAIR